VHRKKQSRVRKLGRCNQSHRPIGPAGPVSRSRANSGRQRFPAGDARCGRIGFSIRSRPVSQTGTVRPIRSYRRRWEDPFELPPIVLVVEASLRFADHWKSPIFKTTETRRLRVFRDRRVRLVVVLVFQAEESPPRFAFFRITCWAVDAPRTRLHLPSRVPVSASHTLPSKPSSSLYREALIVGFVPESSGSVQQVP
jgi:hypothetical protein